jgi:uncharacterized circularly permuted ATP-grasp superfamily protein/uncharacterized alpha-E superfamily protein
VTAAPTQARDELLDHDGRLRRPWRRMLGPLLGMGIAELRARAAALNRAIAEEGAAAVLANPSDAQWCCDPIPYLLTEPEFAGLAAGLAQRATLLEAVLRDIYGERALLHQGFLPPALVYPSPHYLRPCRITPPARFLHLYAADLMRAPDGRWQVLADHAGEPPGLAHVLENRRMMARVLPDMFRSVEVAQIRPFFDAWQDALQRLAPPGGTPGLALLSPGHGDRRWFEHVVLARALGCTLVEDGDLTARDGALWVKTLRGLSPVHVLLRFEGAGRLDPLELHEEGRGGIPGLFAVMREAAVQVLNAPGAGFAEAPGLAALLPALCRHLLGEDLRLRSVESHWLGDPEGAARVAAEPGAWVLKSAWSRSARPAPAATAAPDGQAWRLAAQRRLPASFVPCIGRGEVLEPRGVTLRLFLLHDGTAWRALPGGLARVGDEAPHAGPGPRLRMSKDVWVLEEEGSDIVGPGNLAVPALPIRRTAGDMPSRVADNFYWFGRYLERLENAARLTRTLLARLSRPGLLPRDVPELQALSACLVEAGMISADIAAGAAPAVLVEMLLRAASRDGGTVAWLTAQVQRLADTLRDRLSAEMHGMIAHGGRGLQGARLALRGAAPGAQAGPLADFAGRVLEFSAAVSGYAAENMVRGGGRLFLDLGRRIERAHAVTTGLAHALDVPADRAEAGLSLALDLCDSALTYRSRYVSVVQAPPVLDLVLADDGNPRGLLFQLLSARATLAELAAGEDTALPGMLDGAVAETRRIVADLLDDPHPADIVAGLPARLRRIDEQVAALSDALARQYFTLLPRVWAETLR